jgi:hypothetical protein
MGVAQSPLRNRNGDAMTRIEPYLLNLAGEYRVCSELNKRGIFATVTYGNRKSVDVYAIPDGRRPALRIEVKTGQRGKFVTKITQKGLDLDRTGAAPDFRVLFHLRPMPNGSFDERFFVLSHRQICAVQRRRNSGYASRYRKRHGRQPDSSVGVDNVRLDDLKEYEGNWAAILRSCGVAPNASSPTRTGIR